MYHRNIKPNIFTDITTPAKQSHSPDTGKISVVFTRPFFKDSLRDY